MKRHLPYLLAFLLGATTLFAYAPFKIFPITLVALALLYVMLMRAPTARIAAGLGWVWGWGAFCAGLSWLFIALHRYGGMATPLSLLALGLFCAFLALYPCLAAWAFFKLTRSYNKNRDVCWSACLFAACWALAEYLRGVVFTGFPWLAVGYSQTPPSLFAGYASVLGVYGVGFMLALVAALCAQIIMHGLAHKTIRFDCILITAALCVCGWSLCQITWTRPVGDPIRVALLQTNIAQDLKWERARLMDWLRLNLDLVRTYSADLIVLPETSLPLLEEQLPDGYLDAMARSAHWAGGNVIVGVFTRDRQGHIFNSALTFGVSPAQRYSKNHLVPFGEFIPPFFAWFYRFAQIPMADQTGGGAVQPNLRLGTQRVAVNICYEDLFGADLLYALPDATLMLNLSNLAWYGESHAQAQHLQIAQIRALETGRPMLRATNTGMTAVVAPNGIVQAQLPAFKRAALITQVVGYEGMTPYARWGNLPMITALVGMLAIAVWQIRKTDINP